MPMNYYYNTYCELYCVEGTTYAMETVDDLMAALPDYALTEIEMPDYITEYYDGATW